MSSKSKRQQTMAKRTREQAVREKRAMKQEKKAAAAAARAAAADGTLPVEAEGEAVAGTPEAADPPVVD